MNRCERPTRGWGSLRRPLARGGGLRRGRTGGGFSREKVKQLPIPDKPTATYPRGTPTLALVATPIGNLKDVTLRGLRVPPPSPIAAGGDRHRQGAPMNEGGGPWPLARPKEEMTDMNGRKRFPIRTATLLLALAALAGWALLGSGGRTESAGALSVSMTDAPDPVAAGGTVTYTITVENTGTEDEDGVVLNDTLTGPATIASAVPSQGACNPPTPSTVHCSLGTIGPGATATITVEKVATKGVGGIGEFVDPSELRAAPAEAEPSSSGPPLGGIAGGAAAAAVMALGAGGWYARRRWLT